MTQNNASLYIHEWMIIFFLITNLILVTSVSHSCSSLAVPDREKPVHEIAKTEIEVFIDGFVEMPGKYVVKKGAKLKELIDLAKLKKNADLKRLNLQAKLKNGQRIMILAQKTIKIILNFEDSSNFELEVRKGTKCCDLSEIYPFQEGIDLQNLNKKRLLKDGEQIKIHSKSPPKEVLKKI